MLQQPGLTLNHIHAGAAFVRLRQLCQQERGLLWQPAAQQLLEHMEQQLLTPAGVGQCGARELSNIMHASACLRRANVVALLLPRLVSKLPEAKPQNIASSVWAMATLGQQVPAAQLQALLAALISKLPEAKPQNIANSVWAMATLGQQVPAAQLQALLAALISKLPEAKPQNIANCVWAVAMLGQQVPAAQLQALLAALVSKLPEANPQGIANSVWAASELVQQAQARQLWQQVPQLDTQLLALVGGLTAQLDGAVPQDVSNTLLACARLSCVPTQLLSALDSEPQLLHRLLQVAAPQELANTAWACALLACSGSQVPGAALLRAERLLQERQQQSFTAQELANLCWAAAVLDLQQHVPIVARLARACSKQWDSMSEENLCQLYQVHLWLCDCLASEAGQGLCGQCLSEAQLEQCRISWEQQLDDSAGASNASLLQRGVFAALQRCLPASAWQQQPAMEQRTADGAYSIDIAATTAAGAALAIEVDGPHHFLRPGRSANGPTQCRDRALAARGYRVVSIPHWEWAALEASAEQQATYLRRVVLTRV